jgi:hypothetical protein
MVTQASGIGITTGLVVIGEGSAQQQAVTGETAGAHKGGSRVNSRTPAQKTSAILRLWIGLFAQIIIINVTAGNRLVQVSIKAINYLGAFSCRGVPPDRQIGPAAPAEWCTLGSALDKARRNCVGADIQ